MTRQNHLDRDSDPLARDFRSAVTAATGRAALRMGLDPSCPDGPLAALTIARSAVALYPRGDPARAIRPARGDPLGPLFARAPDGPLPSDGPRAIRSDGPRSARAILLDPAVGSALGPIASGQTRAPVARGVPAPLKGVPLPRDEQVFASASLERGTNTRSSLGRGTIDRGILAGDVADRRNFYSDAPDRANLISPAPARAGESQFHPFEGFTLTDRKTRI